MIHKIKRLSANQSGDTIIEVLIATVVVAAVLVGTYAAVNRSYLALRDTQERTQSVKIAESQIESLRSYNGTSTFDCFSYNATQATIKPEVNSGALGANPCIMQGDGTESMMSSGPPYYHVSIFPNTVIANPVTYTVTVQWQGLTGSDATIMEYRTK